MSHTFVPQELGSPERLRALERTGVFDSRNDRAFDRLTSLVTSVLDVPIALVTFVGDEGQVFKSCVGLPGPWQSRRGTPLSHSFCRHAVTAGKPLVVEDAREHSALRQNAAIEDLGAIAYAGIPLITDDGYALGTLSAIDTKPRAWSETDVTTLSALADSVMSEIQLAAANRASVRAHAREAARRRVLERIAADAPLAESLGMLARGVEEQARDVRGVITLFDDGHLQAGSLDPEDRARHSQRTELIAFTPIRGGGGEALGIFCLFADESRVPTPEELALVEEAASISAIAIERTKRSRDLKHLAMHDRLTGLPNRALLDDRLSHALLSARRRSTKLAVVFIDLDGFKAVNDKFGHGAGDEVLVEAGSRIARAVRSNDTAARYGGDEFVVLCEDVGTEEQANEITRRIVDAFEVPFAIAGENHVVSASTGLAMGDKFVEPDELIAAADRAMYAAKHEAGAIRRRQLTAVS